MSSHNHTQDHKHNHSEHDHNHDHSGHKHSHGNTHKHNHDHSGHHHGHGGHDHDHDHDHSHIPSNKKILTISFLLITIFISSITDFLYSSCSQWISICVRKKKVSNSISFEQLMD